MPLKILGFVVTHTAGNCPRAFLKISNHFTLISVEMHSRSAISGSAGFSSEAPPLSPHIYDSQVIIMNVLVVCRNVKCRHFIPVAVLSLNIST